MSFWEGFFILGIFIPMAILWFLCLWDAFTRPGVSGINRAIWVAVIVIFPLLGGLAYLVARGPTGAPTSERGISREAGRVF